MRRYIIKSDRIESITLNAKSIRHGRIRLLVPVICAVVAMGLCFINTLASMILFTLLIILI